MALTWEFAGEDPKWIFRTVPPETGAFNCLVFGTDVWTVTPYRLESDLQGIRDDLFGSLDDLWVGTIYVGMCDQNNIEENLVANRIQGHGMTYRGAGSLPFVLEKLFYKIEEANA